MAKLLFLVTEDWYFMSHRLQLAVSAKQAGFDVTVVTRPGKEVSTITAAGIDVVPFGIDRRGKNIIKELATILRLVRVFRSERPELVHLVALKPILLGNVAARLAGIRHRISAVAGLGYLFAVDGRDLLLPVLKKALGWAMSGSEVIVQNPDDMQLLKDKMGLAPSCLRLVRGVGVDLAGFSYTSEPTGTPTVMLAARMLWDKGIREFVEAAQIVQSQGIQARFVLVGEPDPGNPAAVPKDALHAWEDSGIVEWWGHRVDMAATLSQANLVCLPSYREGLPKVLMEAAACGRPIITTDAPGCREVVAHGINGVLVPGQDSAALAEAVIRLLSDSRLRTQMGIASRRIAESKFSQEQATAEMLDIYNELLGRAEQKRGVRAIR